MIGDRGKVIPGNRRRNILKRAEFKGEMTKEDTRGSGMEARVWGLSSVSSRPRIG